MRRASLLLLALLAGCSSAPLSESEQAQRYAALEQSQRDLQQGPSPQNPRSAKYVGTYPPDGRDFTDPYWR